MTLTPLVEVHRDSGKMDSRAAWHGLVGSGQNKIDADPLSWKPSSACSSKPPT